MIQWLLSAGTALVVTLASAWGIYNYLPLSALESLKSQNLRLGTTITTIAGTDTISSSRTTINDNFSALNNGKIENSTTSVASITTLSNLVSIGTITTGSWNATAIPVNKGGTGTTTPTRYQVMFGDASGGLTHASTTGTSGQFLTSNGASDYPSWQSSSIDQTQSYNLTGTYVGVKNLNASSTVANPIKLNDVSYSLPASNGASSTALMENGSGSLSWGRGILAMLGETTNAGATTSLNLTSIPERRFLKIILYITSLSGADHILIRFNGDDGSNYAKISTVNGGVASGATGASFAMTDHSGLADDIFATYDMINFSSLPKYINGQYHTGDPATTPNDLVNMSGSWNNTSSTTNRIQVQVNGAATIGAGSYLVVFGSD